MNNFTWWEKTVEYKFVVDAVVNRLCDFAAPLSGRHERTAGDAAFGMDSMLVLVEFKRKLADLPTEETLFHNYGDAKAQLVEYGHHFIVFAHLNDNDPASLELVGRHYFVPGEYCRALDVMRYGVKKEVFDEYLEALSTHKKADGRGSGHVSTEGMSSVIGVSADGKLIGAMSLHDYAPSLFPAPVPLPSPPPAPKFTPSGPSM
ncbi:hypothetical protein [Pseudomonas sp. SBT1-2]|uniref:hypothetical protein n=1 Tax=Pseudomonas sp. SBT1-2 TaxID=3027852 RepID=UPI00235E28A9|nr:hypothetical protein [Pseudomonas sp. SBT1-2]